jgi:putative addiction module killer protein/probable addiction module antidote protein
MKDHTNREKYTLATSRMKNIDQA